MSGIFNEQLTFKQENGPDVRLVVIGDEHYAQYETIDGFTVVYDAGKGLYCYAQTINGRFVSTGIPMSVPPPPELRRHITESEAVRQQKFTLRHATRHPPPAIFTAADTFETLGPNVADPDEGAVGFGSLAFHIADVGHTLAADADEADVYFVVGTSDVGTRGLVLAVNRDFQCAGRSDGSGGSSSLFDEFAARFLAGNRIIFLLHR